MGPAENPCSRAFQFIGIAASLISLVKGCSDWWVRVAKDWEEPTLLESAKASLFFTPHVLFRVTAMTFCAAFLGYYFLIPLGFIIVFATCNFLYLGPDSEFTGTLFFTIAAPTLFFSTNSKHRNLMKRIITITTLVLLITLMTILILPTIIDHKDLISTHGLRHLNFQSLPGGKLLNQIHFLLALLKNILMH